MPLITGPRVTVSRSPTSRRRGGIPGILSGRISGSSTVSSLLAVSRALAGSISGTALLTALRSAVLAGSISAAGVLTGAITSAVPPTKSFDFSQGVFPSDVTFSRTTTATYINSSGVVTLAAIDQPRLDYDPVNLGGGSAYLHEPTATNYLTNSATLSSLTPDAASFTYSSATCPDGTTSATKLVEDTANSGHACYTISPGTPAGNDYVTWSIHVKAAERTWCNLRVYDNGAGAGFSNFFNLASGTWGTTAAGVTVSHKNMGNGWYRLSLTRLSVNQTYNVFPVLGIATGNGVDSYTGDGASGIYAWGGQIEIGQFATSFIPTGGSSVTRAADVATVTGTNFSSWYNQPEGTFVVSGNSFGSPTNYVSYVVAINVASGTDNILGIGRSGPLGGAAPTGDAVVYEKVSTVDQVNMGAGAITNNQFFKLGLAYKANDFGLSLNGGTVSTDTSASVHTSMNQMDIGSWPANAAVEIWPGHIKKIDYYNTRKGNTDLQALAA